MTHCFTDANLPWLGSQWLHIQNQVIETPEKKANKAFKDLLDEKLYMMNQKGTP